MAGEVRIPTTEERPPPVAGERTLQTEAARCCVCGTRDAEPVAVGEDFEYRTSPDAFLAVRCTRCGVVYLDPRPTRRELPTIYPDHYHAFAFTEDRFGLVHRVRSRLEARRLLRALGDLPADARVIDVGCGDGFHLDLLRRHGPAGWRLEGVDLDPRAVDAAEGRGLTVHRGSVEDLDLGERRFDAALLIQTVEHLADPGRVLRAVRRLLVPGGRVLVVTDNTGSPDFALAKRRHWGGYHFPRHWYLFDGPSLRALAVRSGFEVAELSTMVSPVNWTYSVRNALDDWGAPRRVVDWFSLESPGALAIFTAFDALHTAAGHGALLRAVLVTPGSSP
ncbi:MAG: class I SAM-dependent methyltransferase [Actinobacteria bacterium]|nr:class I SAM-dependent methyltransferase [Actinomycetota bacterium]